MDQVFKIINLLLWIMLAFIIVMVVICQERYWLLITLIGPTILIAMELFDNE